MKLFKNLNRDKLLYNGLIYTFIVLYGATAFVSWYHSITFFNIANAVWLSVLLSFVAEIGQASVLFSILLTKNKHNFLPWIIMVILTSLQVIGNVVSSYDWIITHNSAGVEAFQKSILFWVQTGNPEMFKVIIAWISGALLPIIALSMTALVAQNIDIQRKENELQLSNQKNDEEKKNEDSTAPINASDVISEVSRFRPTKEDLDALEQILKTKAEAKKEMDFMNPDVQKERLQSLNKDTPESGYTDETIEKINSEVKSIPTEGYTSENVAPIPHYSDEELNKMFMDEYEKMGTYLDNEEIDESEPQPVTGMTTGPVFDDKNEFNELDEEASQLTPEIEKQSSVIEQPEEVHTNTVKPEGTKPELSEEQLEKIRQIARDNLKKK